MVGDGVERHRADALRVQLGVRGAEVRAVGEPEEVQLPVAERPAQRLHVARGAARVDVPQQRTGPLEAAPTERARP